MEILAQSSLLVALTSFAFGFSTLAKNVRNKSYLLFAVGCTLISAWTLFFFLSTLWPEAGFYGWHLSMNAWITPGALLFIQYMMRIEKWKISRVLLWGSLTLCVIMSVALILGLERHAWIKSVIYYTPSLILLQTLILFVVDDQIDPVVGIKNRRLLYGGVFLVLFTCVMDHIPGLWVGIPIFGNLALTAFLYLLSQALLRQRLMHFAGIFTRFVTLAVIAFLLTSIYSLVAVWVENDFGLFFLNSFIVSFLLLGLLDPIRSLVIHVTEGLFSKKRKALQEKMRATQAQLSQTMEPSEVLETFRVFLENTLQPRAMAFYLETKATQKFDRVQIYGEEVWGEKLGQQISPTHPVVEALHRVALSNLSSVLLRDYLETQYQRMVGRDHRDHLGQWIEGMKALGCNLAIPLFTAEDESRPDVFGFVLLDVPTPPEEWGANWSLLSFMKPIITRVSEALKKTETYASRREIERMATIGEMAAGLAHEIKNPLGAIRGAAQFLNPNNGNPESRFLRIIIEEVDRLNLVVSHFLDYSKPEAPNREQAVDLNLVAQRVVTVLGNSAPLKVDLSFETSVLEAKVKGAPEQYQQVLLNLIQNSFKSLARTQRLDREVKVRITENADRTQIVLTVEDNGLGIASEYLKKIFTPFFSTYPQGTGLGLPISQKIVQTHGGKMEVESTPLQKTVFKISLPKFVVSS